MHVGEGDFVRRLIRFVNRSFERIRRRGDAQNASDRGDNLPIDQLRTRVEDGRGFARFIQARNQVAALVADRVAAGCQYDAARRARREFNGAKG